MHGANKAFMEEKERFLEKNLLVIQGNLQDQIFSWAQMNNALTSPKQVTEAHFSGVWEFDLVKSNEFHEATAKGSGKKVNVYEVRLLNRVDNVETKERDAFGKTIKKGVTRKVTSSTTHLAAYYCPWSGDNAWSVQLDDDADYFFTATLNGCSMAVEGGARPKVTHLNYVDATSKIDQHRIANEITLRYPGAVPRVLKKDDYTNTAKKTAALDRGDQLDYRATVVGFRKSDGWHFCYQSYKTLQAGNGAQSHVRNILRDRMVPLV